jgi:hypothetical protein
VFRRASRFGITARTFIFAACLIARMAHYLGTIVHLAVGGWHRHMRITLRQGSTERCRRK